MKPNSNHVPERRRSEARLQVRRRPYRSGMRWRDMKPSKRYAALYRGRGREVTVLDTPPEVRREARVRVRYENGLLAGEVKDIPSRRVVAARGHPARTAERRSGTPGRTRRSVERGPEVGDSVAWRKTREVLWTVQHVDRELDQATISGVIVGQARREIVPLDQLEVRPEDSGPFDVPPTFLAVAPDERDSAVPRSLGSGVQPNESLRPEKPRRELDELMDDLHFSEGCLREYGRRLARGVPRRALIDHLREEVRRNGWLMEGGLPVSGEYARVRVERRFDIVLKVRPTPDHPVTVEGLHFPRKSRRKTRRGAKRQPRAA
jgi:hypothetical protein